MLRGTMKAKSLTLAAAVCTACTVVALVHACGPDELPAFANPPRIDNDKGNDDGGVSADAGADDHARAR
jgi:hypothetical protein